MYISTKTSVIDPIKNLSKLESSLNSEEFFSEISLQKEEINFKIKYGLQKVKCTINIIEENDVNHLIYTAKTDHDIIFNRGLELINKVLSKDLKEDWSEVSYENSNSYENFVSSTFGHLYGDHPLLRMQAFIAFITLVFTLSTVIFISYQKLVPMGVPEIAIIGISILIFYYFCGGIMMRRHSKCGC